MDYIFSCFRFNDDKSPYSLLRAEPVLSKAREPVIYRRPILPLQINRDIEHQTEIDEHSPPSMDKVNSLSEIHLDEKEERELKAEAGFLKACGTLPETPAEIRKMCSKLKDSSSSSSKDSETPNFHSWLPNVSIQNLNLEEQAELCPDMTPIQANRLSEETITSPMAFSTAFVSTKQLKNKSVHFECKANNNETSFSSMPLPYPTPLKLTDEMQTPCTAFPSGTTMGNDKYHRIRSEYVYPVLKTDHNLPQLKSLKEESLDQEIETMNSVNEELNSQSLSDDQHKNTCIDGTPGDRPIMGTVATHWNVEEEEARFKSFDFKGIPNTTHKYKEDQKVKWHATPFEVRLEKALLDGAFVSSRKSKMDTPTPIINFDEMLEESNTPISKLLQSSSSITKSS
ncbi:protein JASON-like isoform X2 [Impatiens glandulifera]|uniref:protein JASON-like isoform X2 n=1 Tax=Impatiens glandulifera TaxID=253017 RepID=UPI001FB11087|nr:protein JASON-like isoform X2 [Impatiens glandulifera]